MRAHWRTRTTAITLTMSGLLGLGLLAGCSGSAGGTGNAASSSSAGTGNNASTGNSAATPSAVPSSAGAGGTTTSSAPPPAASSSAGATGGTLSAAARLQAAQVAVRNGGSVHVDITSNTTNGSVVFSDDDTANGGRQVITFDKVGHATILFIGGVGYVQGNAAGLQGFFGVTQQLAQRFADQWISLRPGNKLGANDYNSITAGITLSSVADELAMSGPLTLTAPATVDGQQVIGVQAPEPASAQLPATARTVLFVSDNSVMRPVEQAVLGAGSYKNQMVFRDWGEQLHITAPANAIPATQVSAPGTSVT